MTNAVHGHDVLNFMLEKGEAFSKESLRDAIIDRFGADARFYTCSAQGMTADELISLLSAKGKFVESTDGFNTQADKICNHH